MYPLPSNVCLRNVPGHALAEEYALCEFWKKENTHMFAPDIVVDFPHAVPGMPQHMNAAEFAAHRYWLDNTIRTYTPVCTPLVIPTAEPGLFWVLHHFGGDVHWAEQDGTADIECASIVKIRDNKISYIKRYENPIGYYDSIGVKLPLFDYTPPEDAPLVRMPEGVKSKYSYDENIAAIIANFTNPIEASIDEPIWANDVVEVCPYAPHNMGISYEGKELDRMMAWVEKDCPEWHTPGPGSIYISPDKKIIAVESNGYGRMTWSHHNGHYCQRELNIAFCNETGKVQQFRCYFNPINKFHSLNLSVPSFPYMNF